MEFEGMRSIVNYAAISSVAEAAVNHSRIYLPASSGAALRTKIRLDFDDAFFYDPLMLEFGLLCNGFRSFGLSFGIFGQFPCCGYLLSQLLLLEPKCLCIESQFFTLLKIPNYQP